MGALLLIAILAGGLIYIQIVMQKATITEKVFKQKNCTVDLENGTVTLGSRTFSADKIQSVQGEWQKTHSMIGVQTGWLPSAQTTRIIISIADIRYPTHVIKFSGWTAKSLGEEFIQRFVLAVEQAGGNKLA